MTRCFKDESGVQWLAQSGSYWTVAGLKTWSVRFKRVDDASENFVSGTLVMVDGTNLETVPEESLLASLDEAQKEVKKTEHPAVLTARPVLCLPR
jgi:hypothetical protein